MPGKLKLDASELHVEQFHPLSNAAASPRGTVQGQELSLASCVSCPCGDTNPGGGDTNACASFQNTSCHYCLDEPIGP